MTPKTRAAMQQALECLVGMQHGTDWNNGTHAKIYRPKFPEAFAALREALAEQAEQEPFAWMHPSGGCLSAHYMKEFATGLEKETHTIPLYASPVRTKDLTDDEIDRIACNVSHKEFARAVIAADREKNK